MFTKATKYQKMKACHRVNVFRNRQIAIVNDQRNTSFWRYLMWMHNKKHKKRGRNYWFWMTILKFLHWWLRTNIDRDSLYRAFLFFRKRWTKTLFVKFHSIQTKWVPSYIILVFYSRIQKQSVC